MEQGTGIEPAFTAWEAVVLPIYEPCVDDWGYYSRQSRKFQALFVGFPSVLQGSFRVNTARIIATAISCWLGDAVFHSSVNS